MGKALYRTYRSRKLSEIVGQEHITGTLEHALKQGTISHAYLFTGPRGVGKTSIARILAHEVNGLPYTDDDATHIDIIEIDAASNRRIDEIRDLRDKVHIAPTSAKYKVYIIDEVHMLTREAFNALLKTLEEPPAHVIFILATTEVHKLPETIISRTQRYAFRPGDLPKVVAHLRSIADAEKIAISDEALQLIAEHGEGSFRDSVSLLDQVRNQGKNITLPDVQGTLGIAPAETIAVFCQALRNHDAVGIAQLIQDMQNQGLEAARLAKQLGQALRQALLSGDSGLNHDTLMHLLAQLVDVPASADPHVSLEIALLDAALSGVASTATPPPKPARASAATTKPASVTAEHPSNFKKPRTPPSTIVHTNPPTVETARPDANPEQSEPDESSPGHSKTTDSVTLDDAVWPKVLAAIKQQNNTLFSVAKTARPHFEPGSVTLEVRFGFHQKRLTDQKNKQIMADCIQTVTGHSVRIQCTLGTGKSPAEQTQTPALPPTTDEQVRAVAPRPSQTPAPTNPEITSISNIFGGAEVLES